MATSKRKQMTVGELIVELQKLPTTATWYGWHDETIIVEHPTDGKIFWVISPDNPTT